jgi:hypothetical protein
MTVVARHAIRLRRKLMEGDGAPNRLDRLAVETMPLLAPSTAARSHPIRETR